MHTQHATLEPSGAVSVGGKRYRVRNDAQPEPSDAEAFSVVSEATGAVVGRFSLSSGAKPKLVVSANSAEPEVVRAVAELLAAPRGVFPLQ